MTHEQVTSYADELMAGLCSIPVEELVQCARDNLKATRMTRLSKDHPEGVAEPDYAVRQKTVEWIAAQTSGNAPTRKPIESKPAGSEGKPSPGMLRKGKPTQEGKDGESPPA